MAILKRVEENQYNFNDKMISMLTVMAHVRYLNSLALLILDCYEPIKSCIVENKGITADIINYLITLDEKQAANMPSKITSLMHKYETTTF